MVKSPHAWIGKHKNPCRKHGSNFYVSYLGQLGCYECDEPPIENVLLRLYLVDGVLCDTSDGFQEKGSQDRSSHELEESVSWAMGAFPKPKHKPAVMHRYTFGDTDETSK